MRRLVLSAGLFAVAVVSAPALAQATDPHTGHSGHGASTAQTGDMLSASTPANNAVLASAPRALALRFAHPVMLRTVSISGPGGSPVRASFRRPQAPIAAYAVALPPLASGAYHVRWSATGGGHDMSGELHFTVR